jgi:flagellar assembly protein FliH
MNMKWSDTILFNQPLREVSRLAGAPAQSWAELLRAGEEAGYHRGRRDGENALSEQLVQQRAEIAELQRGILESLSRAVAQVIEESENTLVSLALEAAGRIVAGLPISVELVEGVVREALRQVEDTAEIIVQLHAEDLALLRKHDSKMLSGLPDAGPLRFVTSSEVTRGGCIVQTRFGLIDARREVKLKQLSQTVSS